MTGNYFLMVFAAVKKRQELKSPIHIIRHRN
uniref:Uncharacterized protein n=1 Tax=Anguilla anguilla TaxID=7936 RepID=A0A0E9PPQ7_ANGAN